MNCKEMRKLISAYMDNELDPKNKEKVETHIKECPYCQKELKELTKLSNTIHSFKKEELPANFRVFVKEKIQEKLSVKEKPKVFILPRWQFVPAVATLLVIIGIIFLSLQRIKTVPVEIITPEEYSLVQRDLIEIAAKINIKNISIKDIRVVVDSEDVTDKIEFASGFVYYIASLSEGLHQADIRIKEDGKIHRTAWSFGVWLSS